MLSPYLVIHSKEYFRWHGQIKIWIWMKTYPSLRKFYCFKSFIFYALFGPQNTDSNKKYKNIKNQLVSNSWVRKDGNSLVLSRITCIIFTESHLLSPVIIIIIIYFFYIFSHLSTFTIAHSPSHLCASLSHLRSFPPPSFCLRIFALRIIALSVLRLCILAFMPLHSTIFVLKVEVAPSEHLYIMNYLLTFKII